MMKRRMSLAEICERLEQEFDLVELQGDIENMPEAVRKDMIESGFMQSFRKNYVERDSYISDAQLTSSSVNKDDTVKFSWSMIEGNDFQGIYSVLSSKVGLSEKQKLAIIKTGSGYCIRKLIKNYELSDDLLIAIIKLNNPMLVKFFISRSTSVFSDKVINAAIKTNNVQIIFLFLGKSGNDASLFDALINLDAEETAEISRKINKDLAVQAFLRGCDNPYILAVVVETGNSTYIEKILDCTSIDQLVGKAIIASKNVSYILKLFGKCSFDSQMTQAVAEIANFELTSKLFEYSLVSWKIQRIIFRQGNPIFIRKLLNLKILDESVALGIAKTGNEEYIVGLLKRGFLDGPIKIAIIEIGKPRFILPIIEMGNLSFPVQRAIVATKNPVLISALLVKCKVYNWILKEIAGLKNPDFDVILKEKYGYSD